MTIKQFDPKNTLFNSVIYKVCLLLLTNTLFVLLISFVSVISMNINVYKEIKQLDTILNLIILFRILINKPSGLFIFDNL